ncbi:hypothetical protein Acsp04_06100 [Actinomadura sp. NBRC 104425]|uniref:hypothetical protein n=1 Tax=Actinomadura sp. NBRC 104425 TaxID=3032204 RepID=UPI0024A1DB0C|nr:hypothetical protein [Actinomadura sp. NBRC 104425]GLZ10375.1 hypothetical protein Acsp04_06100 [Actinomadura sp. NBRC 104425]
MADESELRGGGGRALPADEIVDLPGDRAGRQPAAGRAVAPRPHGRRGLRVLWPVAGSLASTATAATILYTGIDVTPLDDRPTLAPPRASAPESPGDSAGPSATETVPATTPAPDPPSTGRAPPPDKPPARRTPERDDALKNLRRSVENGVRADEIRSDVGLDLTNIIDATIREARRGEHDLVDVRIDQLRTKVVTRTREGGITGERARRLQHLLDEADAQF